MLNQYEVTENTRNLQIPDDTQDLVNGIICGITALAARAANSNGDSNSPGGTNLLLSLTQNFPLSF